MDETSPAPPAGVPTGIGPEPPAWARREVAWPLSLLAGFAATWLGLLAPVPGTAAVLATIAILPLYGWFQERGDLRYATFLGLGWIIGSGGAIVGLAIEGQLDRVLDRVPFATWATAHWIEPWMPRGARTEPPDAGGGVPLVLAYCGAVLALARVWRGVLMIFGVALASGALASVAAWAADRGGRFGVPPLTAGALGWPPLLAIALFALLAAGGALATTLPLRPLGALGSWRRRALLWGPAAALVAIVAHALTNELWGNWVAGRLGGG